LCACDVQAFAIKSVDIAVIRTYDIWYDTEVLRMTTLSASDARKRLYNLVDEVKETHIPVHIVGKRSSAILVSEEDWRAIEETLYLVSIPGMRESIKKGLKTPVNKCAEEPGW
jgi:antitoxin YefM